MTLTVALVNQSPLDDAVLSPMAAALATQANRDLARWWPQAANVSVVYVPQGQTAPPGIWWLVALDHSDQAGALGYHDETDDGQPLGKAFIGTDIAYGSSWSSTLSHELCEMLIDPTCSMMIDTLRGTAMQEVCDPCEADQYGYDVGGMLMSDFVTPRYYTDRTAVPGAAYDYGGHITAPMQVLEDGYLSIIDPASGQWSQVDGRRVPLRHQTMPVGSRRERRRRRLERHPWHRSKTRP
ncbi:MAG: hypothetical protein KGL26_03105 [Pseudomonadota bacterium]|nr:hypothetical protein [Pseudomonadota bacterium]